MVKQGLLINYEYCDGCHSCEVSCKNEKQFTGDEIGIHIVEVGPFQKADGNWEWDYSVIPTDLCDLCADRTARGDIPSCALHCLGHVIEWGTVDELAEKAAFKNGKCAIIVK